MPTGPTRWLFAVIAWRNLWRNPRRTWLTASSMAFAIVLLASAMAFQGPVYVEMIDVTARVAHGHAQVQHPAYHDDPRIRFTVQNATDLTERLSELSNVVGVAPFAQTFALIAAEQRSFGGVVVGVDPILQPNISDLPSMVIEGRFLSESDEAYIGSALARNLSVRVGDEIVVLGSGTNGGVAAMAVKVSGIFRTGIQELDRTHVAVSLSALQEAFELGDEAHGITLITTSADSVDDMVASVSDALDGKDLRVVPWYDLLPELYQAIYLDRTGLWFIFWTLLVIVGFSIVNTFIMTVFERTREFGMLMSIGMRPGSIMGMLQIEALSMWALGAAVGLVISFILVLILGQVGIPMGEWEERAGGFLLPEALYPALSLRSVSIAPLALGAATLVAAIVPSLRLFKMRPVDALRQDE